MYLDDNLISVFPKTIKKLYNITKGNKFSIKLFHKTLSEYYQWKGKYTLEHELIDILIRPLTFNSMKLNDFVIKNYPVITAYRMWAFINAEFDYVASISATEGKAKSTLALHLATHLKQMGVNVKWKNVFFRGHAITQMEQVIHAINNEKFSLLWFDEAKAFFEKREFMSKHRIKFLQDITAQRKNQNIYLLLIGDWEELDIYFRERRLRENILIIDKGFYTSLFNTSLLGVGNDRFYMEEFNRQVRYFPFSYLQQIELLANLPSNIGFGTYPAIEGEAWNKYIELKEYYNKRIELSSKKKPIKTKLQDTLERYMQQKQSPLKPPSKAKPIPKKQKGFYNPYLDEPSIDKIPLDDYED